MKFFWFIFSYLIWCLWCSIICRFLVLPQQTDGRERQAVCFWTANKVCGEMDFCLNQNLCSETWKGSYLFVFLSWSLIQNKEINSPRWVGSWFQFKQTRILSLFQIIDMYFTLAIMQRWWMNKSSYKHTHAPKSSFHLHVQPHVQKAENDGYCRGGN